MLSMTSTNASQFRQVILNFTLTSKESSKNCFSMCETIAHLMTFGTKNSLNLSKPSHPRAVLTRACAFHQLMTVYIFLEAMTPLTVAKTPVLTSISESKTSGLKALICKLPASATVAVRWGTTSTWLVVWAPWDTLY